jgi:hypothetical protein
MLNARISAWAAAAAIFLAFSARADQPAVHGMLVLGQGTQNQVFLSHLPMFMAGVHDRQVLLRAELDPAAAQAYRDDRKSNPKVAFYTIAPTPFILRDLLTPGPQGQLKSFPAQLFRNHFERPGAKLIGNATLQIREILRNDKFDPCAQAPAGLSYYVFATGRSSSWRIRS